MFTSIWSELGCLWVGDILALCENIALANIANDSWDFDTEM